MMDHSYKIIIYYKLIIKNETNTKDDEKAKGR